MSNQSLVLQRVGRHQAGSYTCHAHNLIGERASNPLRFNVKCELQNRKRIKTLYFNVKCELQNRKRIKTLHFNVKCELQNRKSFEPSAF